MPRFALPLGRWAEAVRALLPQGRTLPAEAWDRRHHAMLLFLWLQAGGLGIYALLRGYSLFHTSLHIGAVALCAILGAHGTSRRWRATWVSLGCMTAGAVAVHTSGGA